MKNNKRRKWFGIIIIESILALLFSACNGFIPGLNRPQNVYGPPEWYENDIVEEAEQDNSKEYDPSENIIEDVYGPPEWFE